MVYITVFQGENKYWMKIFMEHTHDDVCIQEEPCLCDKYLCDPPTTRTLNIPMEYLENNTAARGMCTYL